MGFLDDFRRGKERATGEVGKPQVDDPAEKDWFGRLSTPKKVGVVIGAMVALVIMLVVGSSGEEGTDTEAPVSVREEPKGIPGDEVQTRILGVEEGVSDPYGGDDPTFNDSHVIYEIRVRVKNGSPNRVALDSYLEGAYLDGGDLSVNSPTFPIVDPEEKWAGSIYFGWPETEPPPVRLLIDDPQNAEVLYRGGLPTGPNG